MISYYVEKRDGVWYVLDAGMFVVRKFSHYPTEEEVEVAIAMLKVMK